MATGKSLGSRVLSLVKTLDSDPANSAKAVFGGQFGPRIICLLFMQHLDSSLTFERGRIGKLNSHLEPGQTAPSAEIVFSNDLALEMDKIIGSKASRLGVSQVVRSSKSG